MGLAEDIDEPARIEDVADLSVPYSVHHFLMVHGIFGTILRMMRSLSAGLFQMPMSRLVLPAASSSVKPANDSSAWFAAMIMPVSISVMAEGQGSIEIRFQTSSQKTVSAPGVSLLRDIDADAEDKLEFPVIKEHGLALPLDKQGLPIFCQDPVLMHHRFS